MNQPRVNLSRSFYPIPIVAPKRNNRVVWTEEMHARFLQIIRCLGREATPSKILLYMNVIGLTRLQVASHYQKYKATMKGIDLDVFLLDENCYRNNHTTSCELEINNNTHHTESAMMSTNCGNLASSFLPLSGFCSAFGLQNYHNSI